MKKFLSIFMAAFICMMLFACNGESATQNSTEKPQQNTSASTSETTSGTEKPGVEKPVLPTLYPDKPEGLTEKITYDYDQYGVSLVKKYLDASGNAVEERFYAIDPTLGVFFPTIISSNTYDGEGKITNASACYGSHPFNAEPTTKLSIVKSENELYDYQTVDANGNVILYIKETKNEADDTLVTEYFARGGKLQRREVTSFHPGDVPRNVETFDENGVSISRLKYNSLGNIVSAEVVEGDNYIEVSYEYHENGVIKKFTLKSTNTATAASSATRTATFDENGNVLLFGNTKPTYSESGLPESSKTGSKKYTFDELGYVTELTDSTNKSIKTYTYDIYGRLLYEEEKSTSGSFTSGILSANVYTYAADGSCTLEMLGLSSKKTAVIKTDKNGNVTLREVYNGESVSEYQKFSYNQYGELIEAKSYVGVKLQYEMNYKYNANGDVTEEIISYRKNNAMYDSRKTYEYFENGKLKLYVYTEEGKTVEKIEFFEDGSYCATQYNTESNTYKSFTFSAKGELLIAETNEEGYVQKSTYTYHENGMIHTALIMKGNVGTGTSYLENGNIEKLYVINEQGVCITTEYIRENGVPVRLEIFEGSTLTHYTVLEYYLYVNDKNCLLKSSLTYDTNDNLVLLQEYITVSISEMPYSKSVLSKEEKYENGVLVSSLEMTYSATTGLLASSKETVGDRYVETLYDVETPTTYGEVTKRTTYIGGKITSVYERIENTIPPKYAEDFYDENEKVTIRKIYNTHSEELVVDAYVTYEYYESGELHFSRSYDNWNNKNELQMLQEFSKSGVLIRQEAYVYSSDGKVYETLILCYNEKSQLTYKSKAYLGEFQYEHFFSYDEFGNITEKIELDYSPFVADRWNEKTHTIFDKQGRETYIRVEKSNGNSETYITEYSKDDEIIKHEEYKNDELKVQELVEYDENGNLVRTFSFVAGGSTVEHLYSYNSANLLKEVRDIQDGELFHRTTYEYHKNGVMSSKIEYNGKGNVLSAVYYDEDGRIIPQD